MYQRCTFITLKLASISIPQTFGSFPSRRGPIETQPVPLPAPPRPAAGQQQYRDGSTGALKRGFSALEHLAEKESPWLLPQIYIQKQTPEAYFPFSSLQLWITWFRKMIELCTNCVRHSPSPRDAWLKREWQLTVASWRQHAFRNCTALWTVAWAQGLLAGAGTCSCTVPFGATNCLCPFTLFSGIVHHTSGFPIIGGLSNMAWGRKWKGQCLAAFGAKGNRPGVTSLTWFYLSAKWVLQKYLISVYKMNNFEWESGKSLNEPNIPFIGNGTRHSTL